jgi:DNA-binding PadR family transcriptional regulator
MTHGSPLEYALMGLLRQQPQSGYDLRKVFATTPMRHFSDSPGSIYPALRRLEGRKWITSRSENGSGRGRQVFRITPAGQKALVDWMRKPVTRDDIIWHIDELMLRFAFMDGNIERADTARFLEQLERELAAYVREMNGFLSNFGADVRSSTGALAFKNGIAQYEAHLAWSRRALKEISEALV